MSARWPRRSSQARKVAEAVQTAVRAATSLTCAIGVSTSKVVAKIGSDHRKPGGLTVVPEGHEASFLAPFDVRRLPGVGPKAEQRLVAAGVETIGSLAALPEGELRRLLPGSVGRMLQERARGIDPRGLDQQTQRISISIENTFERDLTDRTQLHAELRRMAERLSQHLRDTGRTGRTVSTKLRYTDFSIRTPVDVAARRDRRRRADRGARVRTARPRAHRPPGCASARGGRRLGPGESPPARARLIRSHFAGMSPRVTLSSDAVFARRSRLAAAYDGSVRS